VSNRLEEWLPRVYRFALRLCQDAHTAEDLTQDTMLRAWKNGPGLRDPHVIRVWLFRITANLWNDRLRRLRSPIAQAGSMNGELHAHQPPPDYGLIVQEELSRTLNALNCLPDRQREVLYLNACEEMSSAEIAEVLGISRESVKANLSMARKRMRELCAVKHHESLRPT
jgi:RNA polymerase sigma-70 factor, ECF subfamily